MPKLYCYLGQNKVDLIEEIRVGEGYDSTSQAIKELIELGIKVYNLNKQNDLNSEEKKRLEKEEELNKQHTKYLLRILSVNADILRCVYDKEKVANGELDVEKQISHIKSQVDNFIEGYLNN